MATSTTAKSTRSHILDLVFLVGLGLKGLDGLGELVVGLPLLFLPHNRVSSLAHSLTVNELTQDPHDLIANLILHGASRLNTGSTLFLAAYLIVHGLVKVALVIALIMGKRRVYPWAIGVLLAFTVFQAAELVLHPSVGIFLLTLLDILIVALTWREWRQNHLLRETIATTAAWMRPGRTRAEVNGA